MTDRNGDKTVGEFPNRATQFTSTNQPEGRGRPCGPDLATRVRRLLEGDDEMPPAIAETIKNAVGANKKALDAIIIAGVLQALQGSEAWGKLLLERGYGKVADKTELSGRDGGPIIMVASQGDKELLEKL